MVIHKNILIVDDEPKILEVVSSYLSHKGFPVRTAETGHDALAMFEQEPAGLVILDLMLPDLSGEEVCSQLRSHSRVPIIMLTAKTQEDDLLAGFQLGADDYLTKPFSLKELHARIEAVLRRSAADAERPADKSDWDDGCLRIDFDRRIVQKRGVPVNLTPKEWNILSALAKYRQKIFTREDLISTAFDIGFDGYDRVIDTHVKNLRIKLEDDPRQPVYIQTVHGVGYRFGGGET